MFRLMVAGGGTGGHLFPGVAVAEEFRRGNSETEVLFVGTGRPVEAEVLGRRGLPVRTITASGLKGRGLLGRLRSLAALPVGLVQSLFLVREFKPDVVLGVGGYVSGPVAVAARLLGRATALHEQNSVPGLTNRLLGRVVHLVFISFESSRRFFPAAKTHLTGNPIRWEIAAAAEAGRRPERTGFTLLISGGSQGARAINRAAAGAAPLMAARFPDLRVIHQTGPADLEEARAAWAAAGVVAEVSPFIQDMERVYQAADLVVCRAGALTLTEVAVMGRPTVFVPLPTAADNHQEINARAMVEAGAAEILLEKDLSPETLTQTVVRLAARPESLAAMGAAARRAVPPDAAHRICGLCREFATGRGLGGKAEV
ncbi:MAG: undecaprenyldiphospho-muramoylpentapeptide beta-N-acetylglucosaminyltransferase [Thermodesulfobacteriota bacterium]